MGMERVLEIERELKTLSQRRKTLIGELRSLDKADKNPTYGSCSSLPFSTAEERVKLFLNLFRCRSDVYPRYWESNRSGKKGYSPVCENEWVDGICKKPKIKCGNCNYQSFTPFTKETALSHLQGKETIGTYALTSNSQCIFLAADFDKKSWHEDILVFKNTANTMGIDVGIERSRSGNGGHAWIFFEEEVPAFKARQVGTLILSLALVEHPLLSLSSFDRLFPNQDYIPSGGFGNLISLPLQRKVRNNGNSLFIDDNFNPIIDQWGFFANIRRLSEFELDSILAQYLPKYDNLKSEYDEPEVEKAEAIIDVALKKVLNEEFDGDVEIILKDQLYFNIKKIPKKLMTALKRIATFANPDFFKMQRMRFSTWNIPRYISCCELQGKYLILPRGLLDKCIEVFYETGVQVSIIDQRPKPKKLIVKFMGNLRKDQKKAIKEIGKNDFGVLVAPPGVGKTVMGCYIISKRKVPTLILVHRKPLMDQWISRISEFLDIDSKEVGSYGGSRKKPKGKIDVAMLQTLSKLENFDDLLSQYGQVIIDECHHIPAFSFEGVLKKIPSKYFLGLTATPVRKDGLQAILYMQCGPIRYEMEEFGAKDLIKKVYVRETSFQVQGVSVERLAIHEVWEKLIADEGRNNLIVEDLVTSLNNGRWPLIVTDRKEHLATLLKLIELKSMGKYRGFVLTGSLQKSERKFIFTEIEKRIKENKLFYILSTGSFIGEGVDIPILDTLILGMPISFKGRVKQYIGRIHRSFEGKKDTVIYDYLDPNTGLTISMFKKRISAYKEMNYKIESAMGSKADSVLYQRDLFSEFHR